MKHYYVSLFVAGQFTAIMHRGRHPLHREELAAIQATVARRMSMATKVMVVPGQVTPLAVTELPPEAAASYWPHDFVGTEHDAMKPDDPEAAS